VTHASRPDLLHGITFDGSWEGWRSAARAALGAGLEPSCVSWQAGESDQPSLLGDEWRGRSASREGAPVARAFLSLGADVACYRTQAPWDALYRVLWRLTHGERSLLDVYVDEDVYALQRMAKAVRREGHKLRAFVRFRLVPSEPPRYVAWFEPVHDVLAREAPFFARRFPSMCWSILTPDRSAHWDGSELAYGPGVPRSHAPGSDALEELWRTYYAHTFNPARVKPKLMRAEMPVRYWKYLPEASLIAPLLRDAPGRVRRMLVQHEALSSGPDPDVARAPNDEGVLAAAERSDRARALLGTRGFSCGSSLVPGRDVRIGTASWTDPTMIAPGVFYPSDIRDARTRLEYYATRFSLVEVDATYYALPSERVAALWAERTPDGFMFDVKAHALMTGHASATERLPRDLRAALPAPLRSSASVRGADLPEEFLDEIWRRFTSALAPLQRAGKLGALLLQLPRWFDATDVHERAVARLRERAGDLTCAVEFRHGSWLTGRAREARTLDLLRSHELAFVMVDAPAGYTTSMPPVAAITSDRLAVVRMHGRRRDTWETPVSVVSERYRYLYDALELREWVPRIIDVAQRTHGMHVLMNNCHANYGTSNADEITALLVEFDPERKLPR
jgi:probable DNA metabolism protein